jgi:WD40 repeat protein
MQFTQLANPHEAGVNDVAFDYYGKRLASCSSDKRIKIYDFNEKSRDWDCHDINRAHDGVIWRLSWAHPEFGQVRKGSGLITSAHSDLHL